MVKALNGRTSPLAARLPIPMEAKKHMDGGMQSIVLTLWMRDMGPYYYSLLFWRYALFDGVVESREAMPSKGSSSQYSSGLTPHVPQIHLEYGKVEEHLRVTQEKLVAEREDSRVMRDTWAGYNIDAKSLWW
jgi:hypothetical protein